MPSSQAEQLCREWERLQQDSEQYERSTVWVKLAAVALLMVGLLYAIDAGISGTLIAVLWLQEAMLRTSQARLATRLLRVEGLLRESGPPSGDACQLHTEWTAQRGGTAELLREYLMQAVRPTVAFPYALLIVMLVVVALNAGTGVGTG